jgi:hypothetical protein
VDLGSKIGLSPDRLALSGVPDLGGVQRVRRNRVRYAENPAYGTGVQFRIPVGLRFTYLLVLKLEYVTAYV